VLTNLGYAKAKDNLLRRNAGLDEFLSETDFGAVGLNPNLFADQVDRGKHAVNAILHAPADVYDLTHILDHDGNTVFEPDLPASPAGERMYQIALRNHNTGDANGRTYERGPSCG